MAVSLSLSLVRPGRSLCLPSSPATCTFGCIRKRVRPLPGFCRPHAILLASKRTYLSGCSLSLSHSSTSPLEDRIHVILRVLQRLLEIVLLLFQVLNLLDNGLGVLGLLGFDVCGACVYEPALRESQTTTRSIPHSSLRDSLHLSDSIINLCIFGQSIDLGGRELKHAFFARLRGQLLAHQHELLRGELGFAFDFLEELLEFFVGDCHLDCQVGGLFAGLFVDDSIQLFGFQSRSFNAIDDPPRLVYT
jgi:hypothetical protein